MFFFRKREDARSFARKRDNYKVVDMGTAAAKRWAVKVL